MSRHYCIYPIGQKGITVQVAFLPNLALGSAFCAYTLYVCINIVYAYVYLLCVCVHVLWFGGLVVGPVVEAPLS